jgi:Arm DNA-binding domain
VNTNILSVRFFVKKYKARNNQAPIYVRISLDGKSVDVSLKRVVALDSWSLEKGQAKGIRPEIKALNANLDQVRAEVTNAYNQLKFEGKALSPDAIKNKFCGIEPEEHSLMGLIEYHNEHMKDFLEWGTMKNYATTHKYIQKFLKEKIKVVDVPLSQLSYSFWLTLNCSLRISSQQITTSPVATTRF